VAIEILPATFAREPDRVAGFAREANDAALVRLVDLE